jgi:hypothetical protein
VADALLGIRLAAHGQKENLFGAGRAEASPEPHARTGHQRCGSTADGCSVVTPPPLTNPGGLARHRASSRLYPYRLRIRPVVRRRSAFERAQTAPRRNVLVAGSSTDSGTFVRDSDSRSQLSLGSRGATIHLSWDRRWAQSERARRLLVVTAYLLALKLALKGHYFERVDV